MDIKRLEELSSLGGEVMDKYEMIRTMTSDSRMISLNTDIPQYKIAQLKTQLFLNGSKQAEDICDWWMRLYKGDFDSEDIKTLKFGFKTYKID